MKLAICWVLPSRISDASARLPSRISCAATRPLPSALRQQLLRDDAGERVGEQAADLRLLLGGERVDEAIDRRGRGVGVHGREDQDAEARELERGLHGLGAAELADQDDVGVLAAGAADRLEEASARARRPPCA